MGKPRDMAQRQTLARVDNVSRRSRVEAARRSIYEENFAVDSARVEKLLQSDSLVPTAVRTHISHQRSLLKILFYCRMPFRTN
jgi:hypothetical protein